MIGVQEDAEFKCMVDGMPKPLKVALKTINLNHNVLRVKPGNSFSV
jgi:hypothetical protein